MEARFEVSRRESPNQRDESERNERVTQSARAARSLARVAVVVTLFLVIATQQKQAESSRGTGEIAHSTGSTCKSSIHSSIVL